MLGIDSIFGLPLHALVVHFAVVLIPLAVMALIVTVWNKEWRHRYILAIALVAIAGAGATLVAAQTGETLQGKIEREAQIGGYAQSANGGESNILGDHPEEGSMAEIASIAFAAAAAGMLATEQFGQRIHVSGTQTKMIYATGCAIGVVALVAIVIAGHSGATLVWKDVGNFVRPS